MKPIAFLISCCLLVPALAEGDRPNVLWITSEDNASHWLGCYGNEEALTPRLDALAKEGNRFLHAYSNAPVCAVARSTLLTGAYAVTMGTEHMRSRHPVPAVYRPYVSYLRELGYYCTNSSKTDFNIKGDDKGLWDECGGKAHYKNRPEGKPFFAIFNLTTSHESSLFPKKKGKGPTRLKPAELTVPPYLPDLPEVRSDFAKYHDIMTKLDGQVGALLDGLKEGGLAEDTIVFYYGDHGGPTPRGKRYLKDTGVKVPLLIHIPEKWRGLSPFKPGASVAEPVAFVDFAPTLLSLVGAAKPEQMQGRPFLGKHRVAPPKDDIVFLFADRFDEIYGMRRGLTDGRWKYIRRFTPNLAAAPYSYYQFSMASWVAWRKAWEEGKLSGIHKAIWEKPQLEEELFDTKADPWEIKNLASDPAHADRLAAMRVRLKQEMKELRDTGLIPEPMFSMLAGDGTIAEFAKSDRFDLGKILNLAFLASDGDASKLPRLKAAAVSADPIKRYWGLHGMLVLGEEAASARDLVTAALKDDSAVNRMTAAEILLVIGGREEGAEALVAELDKKQNEQAMQYLSNAISRSKLDDEVSDEWVRATLKNKRVGAYVKRFAERLAEDRGF